MQLFRTLICSLWSSKIIHRLPVYLSRSLWRPDRNKKETRNRCSMNQRSFLVSNHSTEYVLDTFKGCYEWRDPCNQDACTLYNKQCWSHIGLYSIGQTDRGKLQQKRVCVVPTCVTISEGSTNLQLSAWARIISDGADVLYIYIYNFNFNIIKHQDTGSRLHGLDRLELNTESWQRKKSVPPNGPHKNTTTHQCWHPAVFFHVLFSSILRNKDARLQSALSRGWCVQCAYVAIGGFGAEVCWIFQGSRSFETRNPSSTDFCLEHPWIYLCNEYYICIMHVHA